MRRWSGSSSYTRCVVEELTHAHTGNSLSIRLVLEHSRRLYPPAPLTGCEDDYKVLPDAANATNMHATDFLAIRRAAAPSLLLQPVS